MKSAVAKVSKPKRFYKTKKTVNLLLKIYFLVQLTCNLKKLLSYLKSASLIYQNSKQKKQNKKTSNLGLKMLYFSIWYLDATLKNYYYIGNQHPQICRKAKFV